MFGVCVKGRTLQGISVWFLRCELTESNFAVTPKSSATVSKRGLLLYTERGRLRFFRKLRRTARIAHAVCECEVEDENAKRTGVVL